MYNSRQLEVLVKESWDSSIERVFERNLSFTKMLIPRIRKSTVAKNLLWKVNVGVPTGAGSYDETGSMGIYNAQGPVDITAQMDWKLNKAPVRLTGLAQAISGSSDSVVDVLARNTDEAMEELHRNMDLQCLSDGMGAINSVDPRLKTTGTDITGILAAIDDGSRVSTYANIDRGLAAFWRSFTLSNGGVNRAITENLVHQVLEEMVGIRQAHISDAWMSQQVYRQFGILLGQDRQYTINAGETPRYTGGFTSLRFAGGGVEIDMTAIPLYANNRMDFLNIKDLEYHILSDLKVQGRDAGDQDATVLVANTYTQLMHRNPWKTASIRDIDAS